MVRLNSVFVLLSYQQAKSKVTESLDQGTIETAAR